METLEQDEDALEMAGIDADAVVADRNDPVVIHPLGARS